MPSDEEKKATHDQSAPAIWPTGGSDSGFERYCCDDSKQATTSHEQPAASCSERQGEWAGGLQVFSAFHYLQLIF